VKKTVFVISLLSAFNASAAQTLSELKRSSEVSMFDGISLSSNAHIFDAYDNDESLNTLTINLNKQIENGIFVGISKGQTDLVEDKESNESYDFDALRFGWSDLYDNNIEPHIYFEKGKLESTHEPYDVSSKAINIGLTKHHKMDGGGRWLYKVGVDYRLQTQTYNHQYAKPSQSDFDTTTISISASYVTSFNMIAGLGIGKSSVKHDDSNFDDKSNSATLTIGYLF